MSTSRPLGGIGVTTTSLPMSSTAHILVPMHHTFIYSKDSTVYGQSYTYAHRIQYTQYSARTIHYHKRIQYTQYSARNIPESVVLERSMEEKVV